MAAGFDDADLVVRHAILVASVPWHDRENGCRQSHQVYRSRNACPHSDRKVHVSRAVDVRFLQDRAMDRAALLLGELHAIAAGRTFGGIRPLCTRALPGFGRSAFSRWLLRLLALRAALSARLWLSLGAAFGPRCLWLRFRRAFGFALRLGLGRALTSQAWLTFALSLVHSLRLSAFLTLFCTGLGALLFRSAPFATGST